ncbi:hypothetical protein [Runella limosa]|uniref:hypothetical protein n=1 Tax=Runella limosa TaxID=370978 RepID=UPI000418AD8E|nr:hypothetical protein [Runella limosa]
MAEVIIKRRYTNYGFYEPKEAEAFKNIRTDLMNRYGSLVKQAVALANIPLTVFQGIILIENAKLDPQFINSFGFVGLGQINTDTASDVIIREKKKKRLSNEEIELLRKQLGKRIDVLFASDVDPKKAGNQPIDLGYSIVNNNDLKNVEFNLLVSAMYASQLIDEEIERTSDGELVRLDRVIVRYNQGYYYKIPKAMTDTLIAQLPKEPRNYIKKMAGANGMMETLS